MKKVKESSLIKDVCSDCLYFSSTARNRYKCYTSKCPAKHGMTSKNSKKKIMSEGKCPVDGRKDRPIFIIFNNKRTLAVADGKGHAYKVYGKGYDAYNSVCLEHNIYDPKDYEFDRGLSGMDF